VREHHDELKKAITKLAVVYTPGLIGTIAAGFFRLVAPPYPFELFEDPLEACRWLGEGVDDGPALFAELDAIQAKAVGTAPFLLELRTYLHAHTGDATLQGAARALGVSERSFQRRLSEHGTKFPNELAAARVRSAQTLLVDTDASLTQIAFAVGCTSLHQFSKAFRKVTGASPMQWREQHAARLRG
jgi:AraC-like DNA-binding protein